MKKGIKMKGLLTVLLTFVFITLGCDKSTTNSDDNADGINTHATVNVKSATEYFNFSTNSGSSNPSSAYDVEFYAVRWNPTGAPPEIIIDDPRFRTNDGLSIAVLNDAKLEDVVDVPAAGEFVTNFLSEKGEWYYTTSLNIVLPYDHVYIVNTADGKFPAFQIISYYDDMGESGVFNIEWKYLSE
jgi:hypothetical protein